MKKRYCVYLIVILLLSLCSCAVEQQPPEGSVAFYYQRSSIHPAESDAVISKDFHVLSTPSSDYISVLNTYLQGPVSDPLHRVFPTGITLISLDIQNKNASIVLGGTFNALEGMEQTIFCACLTLTVCDLTGAQQVSIYREQDTADGGPVSVMRPEDIVLLDDCKLEVDHD